MKKSFTKIISIFIIGLIISVCFNLTTINTYAYEQPINKIITEQIPNDVINFATSNFEAQLSSIKHDPNNKEFKTDQINSAYLGTPFKIYCYENNDINNNNNIYHFPVISNNNVIAIYTIGNFSKDEYSATFSKSFADNLNSLLKTNKTNTIKIISVDNDIYALSNDKNILLSTDKTKSKSSTNDDVNKAKSILQSKKNNNEKTVDIKKQSENFKIKSKSNDVIYGYDPDAPIDYLALPVKIVLQGDKPWCAGASCAAILNYKKGLNLSAADVISNIYGWADPNKGLNLTQIQQVYKNYGYNIYTKNPLSYEETKSALKSNWPINTLMVTKDNSGHSMVLKSYYLFRDGSKYYSMIDPNYSQYVTVSAKNDGSQVYYILNNKAFYWTKSIY